MRAARDCGLACLRTRVGEVASLTVPLRDEARDRPPLHRPAIEPVRRWESERMPTETEAARVARTFRSNNQIVWSSLIALIALSGIDRVAIAGGRPDFSLRSPNHLPIPRPSRGAPKTKMSVPRRLPRDTNGHNRLSLSGRWRHNPVTPRDVSWSCGLARRWLALSGDMKSAVVAARKAGRE